MKLLSSAAVAAALLLAVSPAQAFWKITITSEVPQSPHRWDPEWKQWVAWGVPGYQGRCWKIGGHDVDSGPRETYLRRDGEQTGNHAITLNTEVETGCKTSWLDLHVWYNGAHGAAVMTRTFKFKGIPGGAFGKWEYYAQDQEVARRYWNDANICTEITIYGQDKPDKIHSYSC